jgi:hypothetical protein
VVGEHLRNTPFKYLILSNYLSSGGAGLSCIVHEKRDSAAHNDNALPRYIELEPEKSRAEKSGGKAFMLQYSQPGFGAEPVGKPNSAETKEVI